MSRSVKTKTLRIVLCLLMAIALLPFIANTAEAAERHEDFTTVTQSSDPVTFTGTHFKIEAVDGGADGMGIFISTSYYGDTATISSLDGTLITKLVMTRGYYYAEGTLVDHGTVSISDDGDTITVTDINSTSVTISHADGDGPLKYVQINSIKVYYEDDDILAEDIALSPTSLTLEEGDTATITADVTPDTATYKTVAWSSSDESVATVDSDGKVTAVSEGECDITATITNGSDYTDDDVVKTCKVTVRNLIRIKNIDLKIAVPVEGDEVTMEEGNLFSQNPRPNLTIVSGEVEKVVVNGKDYTFWLNGGEEGGIFSGKFVAGKEYGVMAILQAKDGYTFADDVKVTVNGKEISDFMFAENAMVIEAKLTAVRKPYTVPDTSVK